MNEVVISNYCVPLFSGCGLLVASESFYHADRTADFNVLIFVIEGCIFVTEEDTDYEVRPGELLILKSGVHHFGKKKTQKGTKWIFVHFKTDEKCTDNLFYHDSSPLGSYDSCSSFTMTLPKYLHSVSKRTENSLYQLVEYSFSDDRYKRWYVNERLFSVLSSAAIDTDIDSGGALSDRVCRFLADNISAPFSSCAVEKHFFLSYKYIAAVFKKEKGITMQHYHNAMRMEEACRLLCSTLMRVGDIADKLGFSDMLYFSRCFHRYTGKSPSRYRKESARFI